MPGARLAEIVQRHIRERGEPMTLKRTGQADLAVTGKRTSNTGPDELAEGLAQNDMMVIISDAEIAASDLTTPPSKGDRIVIAGHTYTLLADAITHLDSGVVLQHRLRVRGA